MEGYMKGGAATIPVEVFPLTLVARNFGFDKDIIRVPAGAHVQVAFENKDPDVRHNLGIYTDSSASVPIFVGELVAGPGQASYEFDAPQAPGSYFFTCSAHPQLVYGFFIVK